MIPRRLFIKKTGLAMAACAITPSFSLSNKKEMCIGIQLYSLRDIINKNPKEVLQKLANIGFDEIETYGFSEYAFWGLKVSELKEELIKNELKSPSGHYDGNPIIRGDFDDLKGIISVANTLNQDYIIIPSIDEELRKSKSDYLNIAEKFNHAGEMCKAAGVQLAYHNHAFEFEKFDGLSGFDILLKNTEENLVTFEMDIYWVVRAGIDPISLFKKYPGRFKLWHIKDMDKENPELNTEIGNGRIVYSELLKYAQTSGVEKYILEQENFEISLYESLHNSYSYMKNNLL